MTYFRIIYYYDEKHLITMNTLSKWCSDSGGTVKREHGDYSEI